MESILRFFDNFRKLIGCLIAFRSNYLAKESSVKIHQFPKGQKVQQMNVYPTGWSVDLLDLLLVGLGQEVLKLKVHGPVVLVTPGNAGIVSLKLVNAALHNIKLPGRIIDTATWLWFISFFGSRRLNCTVQFLLKYTLKSYAYICEYLLEVTSALSGMLTGLRVW